MARDPWTPRLAVVPARPVPAVLEAGEVFDDVLLGGPVSELPDVRLAGAVVEGLVGVGARVTGWTLQDTVFRAPDLSGTSLVDLRAYRLRIEGGRLSGCVATGAVLQDVVPTDVHAPGLTVRGATLKHVTVTDCALADLDLSGSTLDHVTFTRCDLTALVLHAATVVAARFDSCTLERVAGAERLRGATVDVDGLLQLAPSLAAAIGLQVEHR